MKIADTFNNEAGILFNPGNFVLLRKMKSHDK